MAASVVIERGLARCPRCVAVADYAFVESGPNSLRYEVHCQRCGEDYCEVHAPAAPAFSAAVEAVPFRPLVAPPSPGRLRWRRLLAWFADAQAEAAAVTAAASSHAARLVAKARSLRQSEETTRVDGDGED